MATRIGTIIDDKYEVLKEIGKGGMSIVYLAMDRRLNKQWAVKEIRKTGNGRNDEVVINSLIGGAVILIINAAAAGLGIMIPLNMLNAFILGVLGLPGAVLLVLLHM